MGTRRSTKKSMRRDREAIKITPTKSKREFNFSTPTKSPSTKRSLFMSPQTPKTTSIKSRDMSPLDSLKKVRCRVSQIGHFSEGGHSRKKPRRSRNTVRKDSPSTSRTCSTASDNDEGSTSPMVSASMSESGDGSDGQGLLTFWDDDDDVKTEENASQGSFSPSDAKKGRITALNSPTETEEDISSSRSPNGRSPLRLSFQSPKNMRSIRQRAVPVNSSSNSPTECVRKQLFFDDSEDEKDGELKNAEDVSDAGSEFDFLFR